MTRRSSAVRRDCYCPVPNERTSQAAAVGGSVGRLRVSGRRRRSSTGAWAGCSIGGSTRRSCFRSGCCSASRLAMYLVFKLYLNASMTAHRTRTTDQRHQSQCERRTSDRQRAGPRRRGLHAARARRTSTSRRSSATALPAHQAAVPARAVRRRRLRLLRWCPRAGWRWSPSKLQYAGEQAYGFVRNSIARDIIGSHDFMKFVPWLVATFFFVLLNNLFGIIPFIQFPSFSRVSFAYGLAILVWLLYNGLGVYKHGFCRLPQARHRAGRHQRPDPAADHPAGVLLHRRRPARHAGPASVRQHVRRPPAADPLHPRWRVPAAARRQGRSTSRSA